MRNALLLACAIVFGLAGIVYADAPFQRSSPPGLTSATADGSYLRLDISNDPLTGDLLTIDPPSNIARIGVNLSPGQDSLQVGDIDGNPSIYFPVGKTHIRSVGTFVPSNGGAFDLGDTGSFPWRDAFLAGDLTFSPGAGNTSYIQNDGAANEDLEIHTNGAGSDVKVDTEGVFSVARAGVLKFSLSSSNLSLYQDVLPGVTVTSDLGSTGKVWDEAHVETVLTKIVKSPAASDLVLSVPVGQNAVVGITGTSTIATFEAGALKMHQNITQNGTGASTNVGYDTGAGGCSAPVTCGVATVGTLFYCRDTGASKAGAYCGCMQDAADAYVWSELTTTIASGAVCP